MAKLYFKKHQNKNDYLLSKSGHWIRDFTKFAVKPTDINELMSIEDMQTVIDNELRNNSKNFQSLNEEEFFSNKIVIIGDGYKFEEKQKLLETLPPDVTVLGVNGVFAKWNAKRRLDYYVVNNPYKECLDYLPQLIRAWPKCVASSRTHKYFLEAFRGPLYLYSPPDSEFYKGIENKDIAIIDDYRNPVCAAISIAYKFGVKKLLMLSTIDLYDERPGAEPLKNNLWIYPQQKIAHSLIDSNLYWLKKAKIDICHNDNGLDYEFASYIESVDLKRFFDDK